MYKVLFSLWASGLKVLLLGPLASPVPCPVSVVPQKSSRGDPCRDWCSIHVLAVQRGPRTRPRRERVSWGHSTHAAGIGAFDPRWSLFCLLPPLRACPRRRALRLLPRSLPSISLCTQINGGLFLVPCPSSGSNWLVLKTTVFLGSPALAQGLAYHWCFINVSLSDLVSSHLK